MLKKLCISLIFISMSYAVELSLVARCKRVLDETLIELQKSKTENRLCTDPVVYAREQAYKNAYDAYK